MRWSIRRSDHLDERGAVAIIVALSMSALLVVAGTVFDFGLARSDKLTNKTYTDTAAIAGIHATDVGDSQPRPFAGACAALEYLRVNDPEVAGLTSTWKTGAGVGIGSDPCNPNTGLLNSICVPNTTSTWAWFSGTAAGGRITVDIKSGYLTPDPAFDPAGSGDNSALGGCDQLAVIVHEIEHPGLGRVASAQDIVTKNRSVARAVPSNSVQYALALLVLERTNCPAIFLNSQNTHVEVQGNGTAPGVIHADSLANGPGCTGTKALSGKFAGNIRADHAPTGDAPGRITVAALSSLPGAVPGNATDGAANVCSQTTSGGCNPATGLGVIGRGQVDTRYLAGAKIALAAAASTTSGYNMTLATAIANGYTVVSSCTNTQVNPTALKIYVNCPGGVSFKASSFPNATDIVFNGGVSLTNNSLSMPNAVRVYVKGPGFNSAGSLRLNTGAAATCADRTGAPRAQLVIGSGGFTSNGNPDYHMCSTTLLMADNRGAIPCPLPGAAVIPGTPPANNTCTGIVTLSGSGSMDWTAPNAISGPSNPTEWTKLEDLALWTETSNPSQIGGGGSLYVSGVYFLPNANPVTIGGNGSQSVGQNAMFIARQFTANGGGTLLLKPNPDDVITLPPPPVFGLVR
jgi:hypothetical protein